MTSIYLRTPMYKNTTNDGMYSQVRSKHFISREKEKKVQFKNV